MITNLIFFLYDIKIDYVRKKSRDYIFYFNNSFYIFKECFETEEKLVYLNSFINENNYFHRMIKNRYSKYLSPFNNSFYVLFNVRLKTNRLLLLDDVVKEGGVFFTVGRENFNWVNLWKNKIDQVEFYLDKISIDIYTLSIINYFVNLGELAINYFNEHVKRSFIPLSLCHKRLYNDFDLYEYFCILNTVFDHYTRDLSEFIKCDIYKDKMININNYYILKDMNDIDLLVSRLLFPSYFFDVFDDYVLNGKEFDDFSKHFINLECYNSNLFTLINFLEK